MGIFSTALAETAETTTELADALNELTSTEAAAAGAVVVIQDQGGSGRHSVPGNHECQDPQIDKIGPCHKLGSRQISPVASVTGFSFPIGAVCNDGPQPDQEAVFAVQQLDIPGGMNHFSDEAGVGLRRREHPPPIRAFLFACARTINR